MGRPIDADGNEVFQEYPKALADGKVVNNAEEEAAWSPAPKADDAPALEPDAEPEPDAPADPLEDVTIEMDNPAFQPAPKKKAPKKTATKKK